MRRGVAPRVRHLAKFVKKHPGCRVGTPGWQPWAIVTAAVGIGAIGGVGVTLSALGAGAPTAALLAALVTFGCGVALPRVFARLVPLRALAREGLKSWAVSDEALLLVDGRGGAVEIGLDRILSLELDGEEPRLRVDDPDQQGIVYAALFDVFDDHGASGEAFVEALEPRLRARTPHAAIVRHADSPLY